MAQASLLTGRCIPTLPCKARSSRPQVTRTVRAVASQAGGATPAKQSWLPGTPIPPYLEDLPAAYGFDPLRLGSNSGALRWYVHSELIHSRFAMAGVAGILIPDVLTHAGLLNVPVWYEQGLVAQQGSFAPFSSLLAVEFLLFNFVELKRLQDFNKPGSQAEPGSFFGFEGAFKGTGENGYPGGIFDPLNFSKGPAYETMKVRELKNGRLAMVAFLGFYGQYLANGLSPVDALLKHVQNPALFNFTTNGVSLPEQAHPLLKTFQ